MLSSNQVKPIPEDLREKGGSNPAFSYCSTDTPLDTTSSFYNKKKAGSLLLKGLKAIPITEFIPYTYEEICDIIENHWFIVYKNEA